MKATKELEFIFDSMKKIILDLQEDIGVVKFLNDVDEAKFQIFEDDRQDFLLYLNEKITQCIVVRLDGLLDEPKDNSSISFSKLFNLIDQSAINKTQNEKQEISEQSKYWKSFYTQLSSMPERNDLATLRDNMMAHLDYKYIKNERFKQLKLTYNDLEIIFMRMIVLFNDIIDEYGYQTIPMMNFNSQGTISQQFIKKLFE